MGDQVYFDFRLERGTDGVEFHRTDDVEFQANCEIGALVELDGLESRPELNGQRARVVSFSQSTGRFGVKLIDSEVRIAVKRERLLPLVGVWQKTCNLDHHRDAVLAIAFSLDGTSLAVGTGYGMVLLWQAFPGTGPSVRSNAGEGWVGSVAIPRRGAPGTG